MGTGGRSPAGTKRVRRSRIRGTRTSPTSRPPRSGAGCSRTRRSRGGRSPPSWPSSARLASLTPEQWDAPTLCERWRVRQVVGHFLGSYDPKLTVWKGLRGAVRSGFSFDRFLDADTRRHETGRRPQELLAARLAAVDITRGVASS